MSLVEASRVAITGRLHPLDLKLEAGTLTALIGPNGSGKTSLLHALARIGTTGGTVRIAGQELSRSPPAGRAQLLSFLPASRDLPWAISARDLVGLSGADAAAIDAAIDRLEVSHFTGRPANQLSTGERSRVLIARALAPAPRLLLLDEPTANLDPLWQIRLMELLREELEGQERVALVAMHDLDSAGTYADRLIVMDRGRPVADGSPEEVLASPIIAQVFGIQRDGVLWRPVRPMADPRSSR
jgi:iron complex transport system ATP-binding protein